MKRRIAMLLSVVAVATSLTAFSPVSPASADGPTQVCAGVGTWSVNTGDVGLTYPGFGPARLLWFWFGFAVSICTEIGPGLGKPLQAVGVVHGWCGLSTGHGEYWTTNVNGIVNSTGGFAWVGAGDTLVIVGDLVGTVNATPDTTFGAEGTNSCTDTEAVTDPPGANVFLINGIVVLSPTSCDPGSIPALVLC